MTIKEQVRGIIKAAPYLPIQALTLLSFFIILPILLVQLFEAYTATYRETAATFTSFSRIQERIMKNETDFFFQLNYGFKVDGKDYQAVLDRGGHSTQDAAEFSLSQFTEKPNPVTIWYNPKNPREYQFYSPQKDWIIYLSLIFGLAFFAYYLKWLLLKYYVLELKED